MSNRIYQIIALAILIGAPVLVNLVSNALPGAQQAVQAAAQNSAEEPAVASTQSAPAPSAPAPAPAQTASTGDMVVDVTPAFDAEGIDPQAVSGDTVQPPPPAPPIAPKPVVQPVTVATYQPPMKTKGPPPAQQPWERQ